MAISKSFHGLRKGKAAGLVYQTSFNAKGEKIQVTRGAAESIANPQSYGQAAQRSRMAAASKLASVFGLVIDHSYEGLRFGQPNRSLFVNQCLNDKVDGVFVGPYMSKGDSSVKLPSGMSVMLSRGSLPPVNVTLVQNVVPATELNAAIMAEFGLQTGDILTMILVRESAGGYVSAGFKQVLVQEGADISSFGAAFVSSSATVERHLEYPTAVDLKQVLVIHERNIGGVYKRSTTYLNGFDDVPTQTDAAIASYMSEESKVVYFGEKYLDGRDLSSDYIDKDTGETGGISNKGANKLAYIQVKNVTQTAQFGKWVPALVRVNADGSANFFYNVEDDTKFVVAPDGRNSVYKLTDDVENQPVYVVAALSGDLLDEAPSGRELVATPVEYDSSIGIA